MKIAALIIASVGAGIGTATITVLVFIHLVERTAHR